MSSFGADLGWFWTGGRGSGMSTARAELVVCSVLARADTPEIDEAILASLPRRAPDASVRESILVAVNELLARRLRVVFADPAPVDSPTPLDRVVRPGQTWRHFKGLTYVVVSVAKMESDLGEVVVYRPLLSVGSSTTWVRPMVDFLSRAPASAGSSSEDRWRFDLLLNPTEETKQ